MIKNSRVAIAICLLLAACKPSLENNNNSSFVDPIAAHNDSTIKPGDNFFMYANNAWFKANPIPSSENSNGIFRTIQDTINAQVFAVCKNAMEANDSKGSNKQKIGDFFASGMDTATIEQLGLTPLSEPMTLIDNIKTKEDLLGVMAYLHTMGVDVGFSYGVGRDEKNSNKNVVQVWQSGLGLPERDYYFDQDANAQNIRKEYLSFLNKIFVATHNANPTMAAQKCLALETSMAKASRKLADLRDPYKNYNKLSIKTLNTYTPSFNWANFSSATGLSGVDSIIVGQPEFIKAMEANLKIHSIETWKNYFQAQLVNTYASFLNKDLEAANFYMYATVLTGVKEQKPRWKKVVENTNGQLGELIGQVYVKEYLPKGTKEKLIEIGNAISKVYATRIAQLDWMSDSTKKKSLYKLAHMNMKMGYPDKWKDMSSIEINKATFVKNIINCNLWQYKYNMNKYGKPVDRTEWNMYPQTYNAYYDPTNNEIVIPACNIIVPGFEGRMPDDAVLYGIIGGSTIGHEITHGFDDQGSQYDASGNLNNWWSKEDKEKFDAKTKAIVKQFNEYKALDSFAINGDATQGENIADLGGVVMGLEAFLQTTQAKTNQIVGGFTPTQRFFLSYGYSWMVNRRPQAIKNQIKTDVHSPAEFRIIGPVANVDAFYEAFNIQPGSKYYRNPTDRVKIW
jgi:putative endopeptidase